MLHKLNFQKTDADHGLFVSADRAIFAAVYVDDPILFSAENDPKIDDVMQNLDFQLTDSGYVSHYLGMGVDTAEQNHHFTAIYLPEADSDLSDSRPAKIPISPEVACSLTTSEDQADQG